MKKFLWGFMPYLIVAGLFFVASGGGEKGVPASGESWLQPWSWSQDETRGMIVAAGEYTTTIIVVALVGLGFLVIATPVVEAKASTIGAAAKKKAKKATGAKKAKRRNPAQLAPKQPAPAPRRQRATVP